jgi:3-oxoacyl-[acyl-carrier protein] reductase
VINTSSIHGRILARQIPVGRIGRPAEIAAAVAFLASEAASFVNDAVLDVTGGRMEYS